MEHQEPNQDAEDAARIALLTSTERCLIRHCCDKRGLPYKLIAIEMNIHLSTVHTHRDKVFKKLKVPNRFALIMYAKGKGLE